MSRIITDEMNMHNCQLCENEWLGRCLCANTEYYGNDVSYHNEPCKYYVFSGTEQRLKEIEQNMKEK